MNIIIIKRKRKIQYCLFYLLEMIILEKYKICFYTAKYFFKKLLVKSVKSLPHFVRLEESVNRISF